MYSIEIKWNREFGYSSFGKPCETIADAAKIIEFLKDSGDGARVKSGRVIDSEGTVVWCDGKYVS